MTTGEELLKPFVVSTDEDVKPKLVKDSEQSFGAAAAAAAPEVKGVVQKGAFGGKGKEKRGEVVIVKICVLKSF